MKKILIFILLIISTFNISAQTETELLIKNNDHLKPVNGILDSYDFIVEYYLKVRKILLKDLSDSPNLRFLTIPSFEPAYVLDINKEFEPEKYYIFYHKCKKNIWYNKNWKKVKIKKYKSEISKQSAELIIKLYKIAINQSKYSEDEILGNDGTDYYFTVFDEGIRSGKVWSPFENTKTNKLVEISDEIIKLVEKEKKEIIFNAVLNKKIKNLIIEFK